jgi:hypothetical protein
MKTVNVAGPPSMEKLLIVVKIETVEVDALAALDLLDSQNHPAPKFDRLASAGL